MYVIVHDGIAVEIPSRIDAEGPEAVTAFYLAAVATAKARNEPAPEVIEGANPEE